VKIAGTAPQGGGEAGSGGANLNPEAEDSKAEAEDSKAEAEDSKAEAEAEEIAGGAVVPGNPEKEAGGDCAGREKRAGKPAGLHQRPFPEHGSQLRKRHQFLSLFIP